RAAAVRDLDAGVGVAGDDVALLVPSATDDGAVGRPVDVDAHRQVPAVERARRIETDDVVLDLVGVGELVVERDALLVAAGDDVAVLGTRRADQVVRRARVDVDARGADHGPITRVEAAVRLQTDDVADHLVVVRVRTAETNRTLEP